AEDVCFALAANVSREDLRRPGKDLFDGLHLVRGQATADTVGRARELARLEAASGRIVEELVGGEPAVVPGALRQRGIAHSVEVGLRKVAGRGRGKRKPVPHEA